MADAISDDVDHQQCEGHEADREAEQKGRMEDRALDAVLRRRLRDVPHGRAHSYTSRYLRTRRMAIRFMMNVATNSVAPTAKIVLYSVLPVGTSPIPTWAM